MEEQDGRADRFWDLMAGIYRLCGLEVPPMPDAGNSPIWLTISIDDAPLCLTYSPTTDADQFVVETELCRPEPGQELEVLRLALEVNLMLARNRHMTLGRHPQTEALLLVACLPLDRVSPESLLTSMVMMAEQRATWTSGQVLQSPPKSMATSPQGAESGQIVPVQVE